jgi:hypothetical protein
MNDSPSPREQVLQELLDHILGAQVKIGAKARVLDMTDVTKLLEELIQREREKSQQP